MGAKPSLHLEETVPNLEGAGSPSFTAPSATGGGGDKSTTMKAYTVSSPSSSLSSVTEQTIPIPNPGHNEVLIRVICAGMNPVDWKRTSFPAGEFAYPFVLGVDCAGTIVQVGDKVDAEALGLAVGSHVHVHLDLRRRHGSYAEYVVCDAAVVVRMAPSITFADAAALPCASWTAYVAIFEKLKVESGKTILISGGSGGVGSFAVQFAKYMRLTVIATCSTNNIEYVKGLGADIVIDYTNDDPLEKTLLCTEGEGVDFVLETVSATQGVKLAQAIKFGGSICNIVGTLATEPFFFERQLSSHHVFLGGHHRDEKNRLVLRRIGETVMSMFAAGVIRIPQLELVRFEQVPDALATLKEGHVKGKIVLSMVSRKEAKQQPPVVAAVPAAQSSNNNDSIENDNSGNSSSGSQQQAATVTTKEGKTVRLPKGGHNDWELDPASGYYWSKSKGLYWDADSQGYFDPVKDQWYASTPLEDSITPPPPATATATASTTSAIPFTPTMTAG